jgi:hypothetical protein
MGSATLFEQRRRGMWQRKLPEKRSAEKARR